MKDNKEQIVKELSIRYGLAPSKVMVIIHKEDYQQYINNPEHTVQEVVDIIARGEKLYKNK